MNSDDKVNILLVDDRPENLVALEAVLERLGENCITAHSGTEALRHVLNNEFAVILLDAQMPDMDGFETATFIRQRERSADVPIIFVTAIGKSEAQVFRGYAAGAVDYVFKPFDPEVLRSKVAVFVNLFKKTRELRRQAEQLRVSEERYALAAAGAADGLWDWNIRTNEVYYSAHWKSILGYEQGGVGSSLDEWLKRIEHDDYARVLSELKAHLDGRTDHFESEHRMVHRNGELRWTLCRGLAVRDSTGSASRMAGSLTDVTRRKVAEEELVRKERLASVGMTIFNVAHSMKNILQALTGSLYFIDRCVRSSGSDDAITSLNIMKSSIGHLNRSIMDMLDYSKEREAVHEAVNCETLFEEVRHILAHPAEERQAKLEFQIEPQAKAFRNDSARLVRTLVNLGTNAIDALDEPGGLVSFKASVEAISDLAKSDAPIPGPPGDSGGNALVLEVRDTGPGIPESQREKIFEPFYSTKGSHGTGLGLSSVKEFMKEQEGLILLESNLGAGTTFRLIFPLDPAGANGSGSASKKTAPN